jgi:hypothetical protein
VLFWRRSKPDAVNVGDYEPLTDGATDLPQIIDEGLRRPQASFRTRLSGLWDNLLLGYWLPATLFKDVALPDTGRKFAVIFPREFGTKGLNLRHRSCGLNFKNR